MKDNTLQKKNRTDLILLKKEPLYLYIFISIYYICPALYNNASSCQPILLAEHLSYNMEPCRGVIGLLPFRVTAGEEIKGI